MDEIKEKNNLKYWMHLSTSSCERRTPGWLKGTFQMKMIFISHTLGLRILDGLKVRAHT
jgi:hypothetical protein